MEATTRNPLGDHLAAEIAFQVECRDVLRSVLTARNTDEQRRLVLRLLDALTKRSAELKERREALLPSRSSLHESDLIEQREELKRQSARTAGCLRTFSRQAAIWRHFLDDILLAAGLTHETGNYDQEGRRIVRTAPISMEVR
ncbi:MAG: hypothetical protein KDA80_15675 [Planctomycetaceae bacterium]|nr:hypothetical protein [Planctomycetaceae bacterium]